MKRFIMYRRGDLSATHNSDTVNSPNEVQFEGVVFTDGTVAIRWRTAKKSTAVWASMEDMLAVHGHPELHYGSELVWLDEDIIETNEFTDLTEADGFREERTIRLPVRSDEDFLAEIQFLESLKPDSSQL